MGTCLCFSSMLLLTIFLFAFDEFSTAEPFRPEVTHLFQGVGVPVAHVFGPKSRSTGIQDMSVIMDAGLEEAAEMLVSWGPHKLIDVQVDDPVGQVFILDETFSSRQDTAHAAACLEIFRVNLIALVLRLPVVADVLTSMLPVQALNEVRVVVRAIIVYGEVREAHQAMEFDPLNQVGDLILHQGAGDQTRCFSTGDRNVRGGVIG